MIVLSEHEVVAGSNCALTMVLTRASERHPRSTSEFVKSEAKAEVRDPYPLQQPPCVTLHKTTPRKNLW